MNTRRSAAGRWLPSPPLGLRLFVVSGASILLSVSAAVWVAAQQSSRQAQATLETALRMAEAARDQVSSQRRQSVELMAQLMASDADLVRYMDAALGSGLGLETMVGLGGLSIEDLLKERKQQLGFDLGLVLDPDGKLQAHSEPRASMLDSYAEDPFFHWTLQTTEPVSGYWRSGRRLFIAALIPLAQQQDLVGFLLVGLEVNDALARSIARLSEAEVAYWLPAPAEPLRVASSMSETLAASAAAQLPALDGLAAHAEPLRLDLTAAGQHWAGRLVPIPGPEGRALGAALMLTSAEPVRAAYSAIQRRVLLAGLLVMLLAMAASYALSRRILQPVGALSEAAERAAGGDFTVRIEAGGGPEIERMATAFNSLLSDLREQRDYQGYLADIARLLPCADEAPTALERGGADAAPEAPRARELTLLALRWPTREARPAEGDGEFQAFDALALRHAIAAARVADHGGELLAFGVAGLRAAFSGEDGIQRALTAALEIRHCEPEGSEDLPAIALETGPLVTGNHRLPSGALEPVGHGPVLVQTERLLLEAGPGMLLLGAALAQRLEHGEAAVLRLETVPGLLSGSAYASLPADTQDTLLGQASPAADRPGPLAEVTVIQGQQRANPAASSLDRLRPGQVFGGRYRILSVIGEGGMGVVYKAEDCELDDLVALKTLKRRALRDEEELEQLKRELKLARRITHPNVLRTHDFGDIDGLAFISMEYVRGMTLRDLLGHTARVPYSAGLRIARQLVAGLHAAHQVGVLHRDIKPENLILDPAGNARLMDFGIARPLRRGVVADAEPGVFSGTLRYAAPEQLRGGEVDARTDVYAVGVVLCELFCGRLPFEGDDPATLYLAQTRGEPVRPKECWHEIPDPLEELILACVDPDPPRRPQSAAEVGKVLGALRG